MKILVFAHQLEVGGTQVNAIELTATLRDLHGHDVAVFATPGPMVKLVREKGLRYIPAPEARLHPSLVRMRALREVVRQERPDIIHAWDWWQGLDAFYGVHLPMRVPVIVTDMCMSITRVLPKSLPTTFGIPELVDQARGLGRKRVDLLLPPVDVHANAPDAVDPQPFRKQYDVSDRELLMVMVSRFSESMKGEGLLRIIDVVRALGRRLPLKLLLVGDGVLRGKLQQLADAANADLGRTAVTLTGSLLDPRPAYAAADLVVGMGGSSLRAMAFGKPVVIIGERGFSMPFNAETADSFYYRGFYGLGDGDANNPQLLREVQGLAEQPERLREIGEFSRQFVVRHFSLEAVGSRLAALCDATLSEGVNVRTAAWDAARTMAVWVRERRFVPGQKAFVPEPEAPEARTDEAPAPSISQSSGRRQTA
jgi:glycosyltransferase involved in cell wall biosynthesis